MLWFRCFALMEKGLMLSAWLFSANIDCLSSIVRRAFDYLIAKVVMFCSRSEAGPSGSHDGQISLSCIVILLYKATLHYRTISIITH